MKPNTEPAELIAVPLHDAPVALDDFDAPLIVAREDGGLRVASRRGGDGPIHHTSTLLWAVLCRRSIIMPAQGGALLTTAARELMLPQSPRWREALSTALLGPWCDPLMGNGYLPPTAFGALRAQARTLHRQLVPIWRRRTRHGRVLSLDADLGDGLSLHDLVAADIDLLARAAGGVFEDERLNTVLRGLAPDERQVVFAYAEGEASTWTEAAAFAGAAEPEAFGERVRRKTKRLAAEQHRRAAQLLPVRPVP
ncbi:hypothetical protein [Streptomyces caniscabiei]|uniref:hypothetical protein n=1 Tax=Streptomyces caniscabiei TaxID=2746961 RepID=UPI00117D5906|nr:hypothetical protein [Streptomyces caniscabiei]